MDYKAIYSRVYEEPIYRMGKHRLDRLTKFLDGGSGTYLDVGCGRAESIDLAHGLGYTAMGMEIVPALCEREDVMLIDDITTLPDSPCETLTCLDVMEHLEEDHVRPALDRLAALPFTRALIGVAWFADKFGPKLGLDHLHVCCKPSTWWLDVMLEAFDGRDVGIELVPGRDTAYFVIGE